MITKKTVTLSPVRLTALIVTFITCTTIAVLLDIPVLQQLLGFLYIAFLPGFLLLRILRLENIGLTVKTLLVVGLSAAFFMIFGLIINSVSLGIGFNKPISPVPLVISFDILILGLVILAHLRQKGKSFILSGFHLQTTEKIFLIVPFLFPTLSILGTRLLNSHDNNSLTVLFLITIIAYIILLAIFRNRVTAKIYPIIIYSVSLSLLLMLPMRSNHIVFGADTGREYYFFLATLQNMHWKVWEDSIVNTCLSITILPSIYQLFTDLHPDIVFKFFVCFLFSFTPLVVYLFAERYVSPFLAFLAAFFYITQPVFLYTAAEVRINVCVFFIAMQLLTIFHKDIDLLSSKILFFVFLTATIFSYYAGSYISLILIVLAWIVALFFRNILKTKPGDSAAATTDDNKESVSQPPLHSGSNRITTSIIILYTVSVFLWHGLVMVVSFRYGVRLVFRALFRFDQLLDWGAKNPTASELLGQTVTQTVIPHQIEFFVYWITFILIGIGVIIPILRYRSMVNIDGKRHSIPNILKSLLDHEFLAAAVACSILTVAIVVLPYLSIAYEYQRLYIVVTILLSAYFIFGGIIVSKYISRYIKLSPILILLVVLIPYFMSITGLLDQSFGIPRKIILNSTDSCPESLMIPQEPDVRAAEWLGTYCLPEEKIYLYGYRREVLQSYGPFFVPKFRYFGPKLQVSEIRAGNHYIFLSTTAAPGTTANSNDLQRLQQEYPGFLEEVNLVYSNGTSSVMK
ncbi:DUF2206 domain-containing protein [Chloroflexota bacterium]